MRVNSLDKIHIALYSTDGMFQGYLKSVSVYKQKVESVNNKLNAKFYSTQQAALNDCNLVMAITQGCLNAKPE